MMMIWFWVFLDVQRPAMVEERAWPPREMRS